MDANDNNNDNKKTAEIHMNEIFDNSVSSLGINLDAYFLIHTYFMFLTIYVDSDDTALKMKYIESANKHNQKLIEDPHFYDAGFDLFLPTQTTFVANKTTKVDFKTKCCAVIYNGFGRSYFTPFYTYARSSISKTPLRLANNQGIIDAGYRGNLIGAFDCMSENHENYEMKEHERILQICAPNLMPVFVHIADIAEELGPSTTRGEGGFGSTGK